MYLTYEMTPIGFANDKKPMRVRLHIKDCKTY